MILMSFPGAGLGWAGLGWALGSQGQQEAITAGEQQTVARPANIS